ncbi:MAG TPA: DUF4321 domain-containing protein [Anaeromyxobacteraceae bacterium]|jgi:hypothetical protein|nr:DUF4321 domain-containing protein [Anaeromyxobacteraceae bacterium]
MAIGPRRPLFYVGVLAAGFVLGGFSSALLRRFLPAGPAKEFFTWTVTPSIGPLHLDLVILQLTLGPIGLQVSLLALVGIVLAFLVARSLF